MIHEISPQDVYETLTQGADACFLLDVREEEEWEMVRSSAAKHYPLSTLVVDKIIADLKREGYTSSVPLYFICASGMRSRRAAELFQARGYPEVFNVTGGMHRWEDSGLPVEN
jgi:rhodanese-related sulfurtransferase